MKIVATVDGCMFRFRARPLVEAPAPLLTMTATELNESALSSFRWSHDKGASAAWHAKIQARLLVPRTVWLGAPYWSAKKSPTIPVTREDHTLKQLTLIIALAAAVASCGSDASSSVSTTGQSTTTIATAPTTTTVGPTTTITIEQSAENTLTVVDSEFGPILADQDGNTLYVFVPDNQGESTCYGGCEENWPAFYSPATPGTGIDGALLGETTRTDNTTQATYGGWPLYYFANDAAPGDTNGQGVGDVWHVIGPDGEAIQG